VRHSGKEGIRTCECCGSVTWTAGVAYMRFRNRTVLGWLCEPCAELRVPVAS